MSVPLSEELVAFIQEIADSVELVELLMLVAAQPDATFTAEEAARRLATSIESARQRLERLVRCALVLANDERYRFAPATAKRARLVAELAVAYRSHRVRVIDIIFGGRSEADPSQKSN